MAMKVRGIRARCAWPGASTAAMAMMLAMPAWAQDSAQLPPATSADDDQSMSEETQDTTGTIVVTARRKALDNAISIKKNADTIIDSVTADEAGRLQFDCRSSSVRAGHAGRQIADAFAAVRCG